MSEQASKGGRGLDPVSKSTRPITDILQLNQEMVAVMTVTAITHRHDAIFQDIVGAAREHLLMGGIPRAGSIYRSVKEVVPTVHAVNGLNLRKPGDFECPDFIKLDSARSGKTLPEHRETAHLLFVK